MKLLCFFRFGQIEKKVKNGKNTICWVTMKTKQFGNVYNVEFRRLTVPEGNTLRKVRSEIGRAHV